MIRSNDRRGFALPVAIGALVIVGVLVTAGFYMARQELRIGIASQNVALAMNLAQSGANNVLVNESRALTSLSVWENATLVDTLSQGVVSVEVTRVAPRLYLVDATATVTAGGAMWAGATRRVGLLSRMNSANIDPPAALTTQGRLTVGGNSVVDGNDTAPPSWGAACDPTTMEDKPGIVIDQTRNMRTTGSSYLVDGSPQVEADPTITTEKLLSFGDMTWDDLVALADRVFPTSGPFTKIAPDSMLVGGAWECDESDEFNLGDPRSVDGVCSDYFPIIHARGDVKFTGGYGQGILLVEGDLDVQGGFEFFGPVFVRGELTTQGTGGHFNGGVVAANVRLGASSVLGNAEVSYSSCAVGRAVMNNASLTKIRPLSTRGWVDLSSVHNMAAPGPEG